MAYWLMRFCIKAILQISNFTVNASGLPIKVNGVTTAGQGTGFIQCITSAKAETGADAVLLSCTPAAAVSNYEVCIILDVSAATSVLPDFC
jgi:hypothetical protein